MPLTFKKSHFFSSVIFGLIVGWIFAFQVAYAASGALSWSEIPALLVLAVLASGFFAIVLNFVWVRMLERQAGAQEEPHDYLPSRRTLVAIACAAFSVLLLGFAHGQAQVGKKTPETGRLSSLELRPLANA